MAASRKPVSGVLKALHTRHGDALRALREHTSAKPRYPSALYWKTKAALRRNVRATEKDIALFRTAFDV